MLPVFNLLGFEFYSYPLVLGMIWALGFHYSKFLINKRSIGFPHFNLFYFGIFLVAWIGAKVLFLITIDASLGQRAMRSSHFWLGGGFVFYGGLIAGSFGVILYSRIRKIPLQSFEFILPVLSLGHGVGRLGCFLAGCCHGRVCELPWSVHMHGEFRHPVQLYEAFLLFVLSYWLYKRYKESKPLLVHYFGLYAAIRFVLEFFRGDEIRGLYFSFLSTSQIISLGIIFLIILCKLFSRILLSQRT